MNSSSHCCKSLEATTSESNEIISNLKSTIELLSSDGPGVSGDPASPSNQNQTDKVFDALNMYIGQSKTDLAQEDEFINVLKLVVKENGVSRQRKKEKLDWMWTVLLLYYSNLGVLPRTKPTRKRIPR